MDPFAKEPETEQQDLAEDISAGEISEAEAKPVRELLQVIQKTKRAFEMYPENNPILQKFRDDLVLRFDRFFEAEETMPLLIRQHDIFYKGVSVYHNDEKEDNLALIFYKDGLREITFRAGIPVDEILDFVDIIRARPETSLESFDDDIVTLLWEKDFLYITYYVVEEFAEGSALEAEEVARLMDMGTASEADLQEAYEDAQNEEASEEGLISPMETIHMGFGGVFNLSEEEIRALKEEMSQLDDSLFLQSAIDVLFESLYLDKGTPDFQVLMDNLDSARNYLVDVGHLGSAALILKRFGELAGQSSEFNNEEILRLKRSLSVASSPAGIKRLSDMFANGREVAENDFRLYLSQLDRNAVIPLFSLATEISDIELRKVVLDAITSLGRSSMDILSEAVKDNRWQVAKNAVAILGRIGDKAAVEPLKDALAHEEGRVRREAVRSLGMIGGPKAGEALVLALEDPDQQIRIAALRYMPRAQSYSVVDSISDYISRQDFQDRSFPEKRAFFEILAEIGQERVLQLLIGIFRKKSLLFSSTKKDELRAAAAYGLGNVTQQLALDTLMKEKKSGKKGNIVSEAVSHAIKKLEKPLATTGTKQEGEE